MADTLTLGDFTFEIDDMPEQIPLGGQQMMAVMEYPGGYKEVQTFGVQQINPSLTGIFNYYNAIDKVRAIYKMFTDGNVIPLQIGSTLNTRYVIIKRFEFDYQNPMKIPYTIELEITPQNSILVPNNQASPDLPSGTTDTTANTSSPPDSTSPATQQTYTVTSTDTLWSIAQQYYGDGTQYRKIADANNIENPDVISIGQQLVIP